jgi:hypothetical protein
LPRAEIVDGKDAEAEREVVIVSTVLNGASGTASGSADGCSGVAIVDTLPMEKLELAEGCGLRCVIDRALSVTDEERPAETPFVPDKEEEDVGE